MPYLMARGAITGKSAAIVAAMIFLICAAHFLMPYRNASAVVLIGLFIASLPILFVFQKENRWDSAIGDLSYPIYVRHILVILTVGFSLERWFGIEKTSLPAALTIIVFTIGLSLLLNRSIGAAVERARASVKARQ